MTKDRSTKERSFYFGLRNMPRKFHPVVRDSTTFVPWKTQLRTTAQHRNIRRDGRRAVCNLAVITHSHAEFVIDFVNVMPGTPKSKVKSRIILTPQHAKRFMHALVENIGRFESINESSKTWKQLTCP